MRHELLAHYRWHIGANGLIIIEITTYDPLLEDYPPLTVDLEPEIEEKIFEIIKKGITQLSNNGGRRNSQPNAPSEYN